MTSFEAPGLETLGTLDRVNGLKELTLPAVKKVTGHVFGKSVSNTTTTKLSLPSVEVIQYEAFEKLNGLTTLELGANPPAVVSNANVPGGTPKTLKFASGVAGKLKLIIPNGALEAYKASPGYDADTNTWNGITLPEEEPPIVEHTILFVVDGKETKVQVTDGEAIGEKLPENPTKNGYEFIGWNLKADGTGMSVTAETVFDADSTVYAVFKKEEPPIVEHTILFVIDGKETKVQVTDGEAIGEKLPENPTKNGYEFIGWNLKADGTGMTVTAETVFDADSTVYAVFKKEEPPIVEHTILFVIDGKETKVQVTDGEAIGEKLPANPTKKGYEFIGWNLKADGTGVTVTAETVFDADSTVYAVFKKEAGKPDETDKPDKPGKPGKPDETDKPGKTDTPDNGGNKAVKTGDAASVLPTAFGMLLAVGAIGVVLFKKRGRR